MTPWRSSNQRISSDTSCPVSTGATPGMNQKTGPLKMIWVVTFQWIHSPLPLCCQEGLEQAGSAWSQHLRDLLPHIPCPHQAAQGCQGEVDTAASQAELVLANIHLLFVARWCSNVIKIIPNFTRGLVQPPRTGALKTSPSKFKV